MRYGIGDNTVEISRNTCSEESTGSYCERAAEIYHTSYGSTMEDVETVLYTASV